MGVSDILHWVLIALAIPLFVAMVIYTVRRARELDRRIDEYHEEEEAAKNQPGPINPYEQMGEVFGGGQGRAESGEQRAETPDSRPTTHDPRPGNDPRPDTHNAEPTTHNEEPSQ